MKHRWVTWVMLVMLVTVLPLLGLERVKAEESPESFVTEKVDAILADGQFVYGPNVGEFGTIEFLRSLNSPLLPCATILEDKANYYSINPRVLLTVLELQSGLVTRESENIGLEHIVGYKDATGCSEQLEILTEDMVEYFYARLYDGSSKADAQITLTLSTSEQVQITASANAGTLAILESLAPLSSKEQWQALTSIENTDGFVQTWLRLFPESDPLDSSNQILAPTAPPTSLLKFPFACGDTWSFSGGPHGNDGTCSGVVSAVDFAPGVGYCQIPTNRWIVSPADGTVSSVSCSGCLVKINHQGGWGSYNYHVANPQVSSGQSVYQDQHIGNPSTKPSCGGGCGGCPGSATGTHVHYALMYNGAFYPIEGTALENWVVHGTTCYNGYLEKDGQQIWKGGWVSSLNCGGSDPPNTTITSGPTGWIGSNNVTFQWTGSDDQTPTPNLVYSYKLDGYSDWSSWTSNTSKTYTNLPDRSYTFRVKAKDQAGKIDPSPATRSFGVDASPPSPPSINISGSGCSGIQNNAWQNTCRDPAFTWSASDSGSGVQDYHYYWGPLSNGSPITWTTSISFDPGAIAPTDGYATHYLNVTARDNLDHESGVSSFGLLYDGTLPTVTLAINNDAETTNQVDVLLNLSASDTGSGVSEVRASNNGSDWSDWQSFADTIPWTLPALNRRSHTVYVQVRDWASNESSVVSDEIYLDLYPPMPHSDNYRICADVVDVGGSVGLTSTTYSLISAIGQPGATGATENTSDGFSERSGFLANITGCLPITHLVTGDFTVTQWVVASGGNLRGSTSYRLGDTTGQPAASGSSAFTSTNFSLFSGFWSQVTGTVPPKPTPPPDPIIPTPTPTPTPGPTPTPQPESFGVSINGGYDYTNNTSVAVQAWGPDVVQMQLHNEEFCDENWSAYQFTTTSAISPSQDYSARCYVYVCFQDIRNNEHGPFSDYVFYDPIAPEGSVVVLGGEFITVPLWLEAYDENSGVDQMRIGEDVDLTSVAWQPYTNTIIWVLQNPIVYAQFQDRAGNESPIYGSDGSVYDPDANYRVYLPVIIRSD